MKKIAVTGANGMTGAHMVSLLKRKKIPFKPITRKDWDLTKWMSFNEFDKIFESVKVIFHFGAQLPYNYFKNDNRQTQQIFDVNVRSCLNLAEWAKLRNIPIIFLIVIFSFIKIAEIIITKTGLIVIIMAALIGVVRFNPSKKNN